MKKFVTLLLTIFLVVQMYAQCYPDRHNTTWYDAWISCSTSANPNPVRGHSHWIKYDLGYTYDLGPSHIWNINNPAALNTGLQDVVIDYSLDGIFWTELGVYTLAQASGEPIYEGAPGPDLTGVEARFLLITALSNYGGSCYGLSELRVDVLGSPDAEEEPCLEVTIRPNPYIHSFGATFTSPCGDPIYYLLTDQLGRVLMKRTINEGEGRHDILFPSKYMGLGMYYLEVHQGNDIQRFPIVKMDGR